MIPAAISVPLCFQCRHYRGLHESGAGYTCAAFPLDIPAVILLGDHAHEKPYPGDHGIQFEPKPGYDAKWRKTHA